jgi:hypothetical protein
MVIDAFTEKHKDGTMRQDGDYLKATLLLRLSMTGVLPLTPIIETY